VVSATVAASAGPDERLELSIVVPVYACASCLQALLQRTRAVVQQQGWQAEWIFVDDASTDGAWEVLKHLSATDDGIHGLRLDRNRGQHYAIYVGLKNARGRFSVVMDCDLDDPPEEIPGLLALAREGSDIVIASYSDRAHPAWRRWGSLFYFWMLETPRPENARLSMFSVLSERARAAYVGAPLAGRSYLLLLLQLGLPTAFLASRKEPRHEGVSSYNIRKLYPLAAAPRFGARDICVRRPRRRGMALGHVADRADLACRRDVGRHDPGAMAIQSHAGRGLAALRNGKAVGMNVPLLIRC
jgi:glycosyltransferase involved in cell wall biosynthesis